MLWRSIIHSTLLGWGYTFHQQSSMPCRHCLGSVQHRVCQRPAPVAHCKQLPCLLHMLIGRLLSQQFRP